MYDVDVETGERTLRKQTPTPNVDLDRYASVRTWATAPDGTKVPVDVVRHVDTPLDGTAPARRLRLRLLRGVDPAVLLGGARSRCSTAASCGRSSTPAAAASSAARW